jgi:Ca2+-binding RTX toxin-like protein
VDLNKGLAHSRGADDSSGIGHDKLRNLENVTGGDHGDLLIGNRASNRLDGGLGDDKLIGGLGSDYLKGGLGNDLFKFNKLSEIGLQKHDVIEDFSVGDKIDLSAIDAKRGGAKNDSFHWLADKTELNSTNANGAVWFDAGVLYGSTDKDTAPEFEIELSGVIVLNESDLIL